MLSNEIKDIDTIIECIENYDIEEIDILAMSLSFFGFKCTLKKISGQYFLIGIKLKKVIRMKFGKCKKCLKNKMINSYGFCFSCIRR